MKLKLIAHLQKQISGSDGPRLPLDAQNQEILGVPVRKVVIPVAAGRNIAVLLEETLRFFSRLRYAIVFFSFAASTAWEISLTASSRRSWTTTCSNGLITGLPHLQGVHSR